MTTANTTQLETQLAAARDGRQKIDLMNTLAWEYRHSDRSRGFELSQQAYELSQTSDDNQPYQKGLIESLVNLAHYHSQQGEFDRALRQFFEARALCETGPATPAHIDALHGIGLTYRRLADYPNALRYHIEALNMARDRHDPVREAQVLSTQGTVYLETGEYAQAIATFQKSLDLAETIGDRRRKALALNNLAMAGMASGDHTNALRYGQQSLRLTRELGYRTLEVFVLDTLGQICLQTGVLEESLDYLQQCLQLSRALALTHTEPETLINISKVFLQRQQDDTAETYLQQALTLARTLDAKAIIFTSYQLLAEMYKSRGDFQQALAHYEQFHAIKEGVFNEESAHKLKSLQVLHETENAKKEAEIYQLRNVELEREIAERKKAEAELRTAHLELQEKNTLLQELNASKDKFFSIISHDLRSPFTTLLGYASLIAQNLETYTTATLREHITKIQTSAAKLYDLLENLLTWSRLQRGAMICEPAVISLSDIVAENLEIFFMKAEHKGIRLTSRVPQETVVYADVSMLNTIFRNFISNALKFTDAGGEVTISSVVREQHVEITVADTGCGIDEDGRARLFRIDTQYTRVGTAGEQGTGLGLILCKDLVEKQGGHITVESMIGKGTTFRFTLPAQTTPLNE